MYGGQPQGSQNRPLGKVSVFAQILCTDVNDKHRRTAEVGIFDAICTIYCFSDMRQAYLEYCRINYRQQYAPNFYHIDLEFDF